MNKFTPAYKEKWLTGSLFPFHLFDELGALIGRVVQRLFHRRVGRCAPGTPGDEQNECDAEETFLFHGTSPLPEQFVKDVTALLQLRIKKYSLFIKSQ